MKKSMCLSALSLLFQLFFLFNHSPAFAVSQDSVRTESSENKASPDKSEPNEGDYDPGLLVFAVIVFGTILFSIGAGIVLTIACLFAVFAMVSFGVLSASVIVGLHQKSLASGFRVFIMFGAIAGGIISGGVIFWALNKILHWTNDQMAFLTGTGAGLVAGSILGLLVLYTLKRLTFYFKARLNIG